MDRIVTLVVALVLILSMVVEGVLFAQNLDMRQRLASQPAATAATNAAPTASADASAELERYKQDYNKAFTEARTLREKNATLSTAAKERDELKTQLSTLQQENTNLKNEVQNLQTMNTINGQVTKLRQLPPLANVPRSFMDQGELRDYFTKSYETSYSADAEAADRAVLQALDMGGQASTENLRESQIETMTKSVLGFYDQQTKKLVVVTNRPQMGVHDRVTYAHEFTHSLQDQHYDLSAMFARTKGNSDYEQATRALIEGDATYTMSLYAQNYLDAMDVTQYQLEAYQDLDLYSVMSSISYSGPMVESAMYFPYQEGATFAATLYANGGQSDVERAFRNPPRSTEQVLHPEKYYQGDEPVAVTLPDLGRALGWKVVHENTLGELTLRIYLEHLLPLNEAVPAGEGWGGDRYQVLQSGTGQLALAIRTAWDSPQEAAEFASAYADFVQELGQGSATQLSAAQGRQRWQLSGRQIYLSRAGTQVLVLQAPDAATLDTLIAQFPGL